jgi:hypothetical protein
VAAAEELTDIPARTNEPITNNNLFKCIFRTKLYSCLVTIYLATLSEGKRRREMDQRPMDESGE